MRTLSVVAPAVLLLACGEAPKAPSPQASTQVPDPVITQFYSNPSVVRGSGPASLCYGVESASEVTLDPPVERLWPAATRCFEVTPKETTTYSLTARNSAGKTAVQKTMVQVGPPSAKIVEVSVNALEVRKGETFPFCVRAINVKSWSISAGKWRTPPNERGGCAVDYPEASKTYTITATGAMGETDTERVSVTVR